jgi:uncharacterized DUF497 family protein
MFEWDEAKRLWTIEKRGLDFVDAALVFDGRPAVHIPARLENEARVLSIALIEGKHYGCVDMARAEPTDHFVQEVERS